MQHVLPVAHGLRTFYALASDKLWSALAVATGLLLAAKVAELVLIAPTQFIGTGFSL